jgi:hypothetical protein
MTGKDLHLGDVIRLANMGTASPWHDCTVVKIEPAAKDKLGAIHLVRPYIHTDDFAYTGGVLWYIGVEEFFIWPDTEVTLLERGKDLR